MNIFQRSLSRNAGEVLDPLKKTRSGIGSITQLDPIIRRELPVAEIGLSNNELAEINQVVDFSLVTRTTLLGLIAAREAARQSGLDLSEKQFLTGLVSATTVAEMDKTVKKGVKSSLDS